MVAVLRFMALRQQNYLLTPQRNNDGMQNRSGEEYISFWRVDVHPLNRLLFVHICGHCTVAMLSDDQSASSSRTPKPVSRHGRKLAFNSSTSKGDTDMHTKEMHDNVRRMTEASEKSANLSVLTQIACQKEKVYELELKLLDVDEEKDPKRFSLMNNRIAEINSSIELLRSRMSTIDE
jgi:3'-phosphoadenosine 5'-phosphosulfate sulfotransferase (PAPS reductase)/FAD synthetase